MAWDQGETGGGIGLLLFVHFQSPLDDHPPGFTLARHEPSPGHELHQSNCWSGWVCDMPWSQRHVGIRLYGEVALTEFLLKIRLRLVRCLIPMVPRDDLLRECQLRLHRVHRPYLSQVLCGQEFIVPEHECIADGHELAEHVLRRILQGDVIPETLAHLPSAVGSLQQWHRQDHLWGLPKVSLQVPADEEIELLVGSAELHVGFERYRIVALN